MMALTGIDLDGAMQQAKASVTHASQQTGSLCRYLARSLRNEHIVHAWQSSVLGHLGVPVVLGFVLRAIYGSMVCPPTSFYLIQH